MADTDRTRRRRDPGAPKGRPTPGRKQRHAAARAHALRGRDDRQGRLRLGSWVPPDVGAGFEGHIGHGVLTPPNGHIGAMGARRPPVGSGADGRMLPGAPGASTRSGAAGSR